MRGMPEEIDTLTLALSITTAILLQNWLPDNPNDLDPDELARDPTVVQAIRLARFIVKDAMTSAEAMSIVQPRKRER